MKFGITFAFFLCLWVIIAFSLDRDTEYKGNREIKNFRIAKNHLPRVWKNNETFYCGCSFKGKRISFKLCGYKPRKNIKRARRLEWDHVVPASRFTTGLSRRKARKTSQKFNFMEADLYNLVPSIGEVNGDRSNYNFGIVSGEVRKYGKCDIEIKNRAVEPNSIIRGDIARIYFYMSATYPKYIKLSKTELRMFREWDKFDPVDEVERKRAAMIKKIQGNKNRFVE
jgi:deoxyribonuclease-1